MRTTEAPVREESYMSLDQEVITLDVQLKAEKELEETDKTRERCLDELKILLKGEKNLSANVSDDFLLQFLRAKKFKTNPAFNTLKKFYSHRVLYPSVYNKYSPKQNLEVLEMNLLNFLPLRAPDDSAIWVARIGLWDPKDFDFEALLRFGILCHEKALQNPITQICGITSIVDLQGFSWSHLLHMSTSMIKGFVSLSQDCLPIRHKAIHIINNPGIFRILFAIMRPLMTFKITNRIHFHGYEVDNLHQHLPPCLLPEEFGGTLGPFKNDQFYDSLLQSEEQFLEQQKYRYIAKNEQ